MKGISITARCVEMIEVTVTEGEGVLGDPKRRVVYYFRTPGTLAARYDEWEEERAKKEAEHAQSG